MTSRPDSPTVPPSVSFPFAKRVEKQTGARSLNFSSSPPQLTYYAWKERALPAAVSTSRYDLRNKLTLPDLTGSSHNDPFHLESAVGPQAADTTRVSLIAARSLQASAVLIVHAIYTGAVRRARSSALWRVTRATASRAFRLTLGFSRIFARRAVPIRLLHGKPSQVKSEHARRCGAQSQLSLDAFSGASRASF